jgi:hypothetical protein
MQMYTSADSQKVNKLSDAGHGYCEMLSQVQEAREELEAVKDISRLFSALKIDQKQGDMERV